MLGADAGQRHSAETSGETCRGICLLGSYAGQRPRRIPEGTLQPPPRRNPSRNPRRSYRNLRRNFFLALSELSRLRIGTLSFSGVSCGAFVDFAIGTFLFRERNFCNANRNLFRFSCFSGAIRAILQSELAEKEPQNNGIGTFRIQRRNFFSFVGIQRENRRGTCTGTFQ